MINHGIAVKALIVKGSKILLLKRSSIDIHKPGAWDIPGGRLEQGEDPFEGLKREVWEETNLEIDIEVPIDVQHFTREDGQVITMIVFLASTKDLKVILSDEHTEYKWESVDDISAFPGWVHTPLLNFHRFNMDRGITISNESKTLKTYRILAKDWSQNHDTDRFWKSGFDLFESLLPKGSKLLEIGAGSGRDARELIPIYNYIGTDITPEFISIAKKNNPTGKFLVRDLFTLGFENNTFDGFWASAVLLHIPRKKIAKALKAIHDVTRNEGIGFISLKEGVGEKLVTEVTKEGHDDQRLFSYYQKDEFKKILEDNGYIVLDVLQLKNKKTTWFMYFVKVIK